MKSKTWAWVAILTATAALAGLVTVLGIGFFLAARNVEVREADAGQARQQFDNLLGGFAGQQPYLEVEDGKVFKTAERRGSPESRRVEALHVLAWNADNGRLFQLTLPFWFLRLSGGTLDLAPGELPIDLGRIELTVEELRGAGPGLILDYARDDGSRAVIWTE